MKVIDFLESLRHKDGIDVFLVDLTAKSLRNEHCEISEDHSEVLERSLQDATKRLGSYEGALSKEALFIAAWVNSTQR